MVKCEVYGFVNCIVIRKQDFGKMSDPVSLIGLYYFCKHGFQCAVEPLNLAITLGVIVVLLRSMPSNRQRYMVD